LPSDVGARRPALTEVVDGYAQAMTDDGRVARREIADALVRALERRHELLDVVVESEDYDAAIEAVATRLGTSSVAAEAVLRLSFDRLTKVSRRRIAAELEDLNNQLSFTMGEQASSEKNLVLRPFAADLDRDIFAARTNDVRAAGDGSGAPPGDLDDEIRAAVSRVAAEEAAWLVALDGSQKVGMVFGELAGGEVNVRIWIHPDYRKKGYGTAALRKSRSEMAAYFPAVPLVVRAPAAGP
jgi:GNAT superfamily N-acetyltransferase